jgi:hypothetical protein
METSSVLSVERIDDHRRAARLQRKGVIMLSDESSEYYFYAQVGNISGDGMYFESENPLRPGSKLEIRYDNPPFKSSPKKYHAVVRWCKPLSDEETVNGYGVGVKYT